MTKAALLEQVKVLRTRLAHSPLPKSREASLAVTKLDEAEMWLERAPEAAPAGRREG